MLGGPPAAAAAEAVPGSGFTRAELGPGVTAGIELEAALPALVDCIKNRFGWSVATMTMIIVTMIIMIIRVVMISIIIAISTIQTMIITLLVLSGA